MKDKSKAKQAIVRRVDIDTILRAKSGDQTALEKVLEHYKGYMLELCQFELYDASGRVYTCYDEDLYKNKESRQMKLPLKYLHAGMCYIRCRRLQSFCGSIRTWYTI